MIDSETADKIAASAGCTTQGRSVESLYSKDYIAEMEKDREDRAQRHSRESRLNIFAEILRARPDLSPAQAADAAVAVHKQLSD